MMRFSQHYPGEVGFINFPQMLGIFILVLAGLTMLNSCFFSVNRVEVVNNHEVTTEEILLFSGLTLRQTIFQINHKKIEKLLLKNPVISAADVDVIFPNKVRITVQERIPMCLIHFKGLYACVATDGIVMYYPAEQDHFRIPLVTGCSFLRPELGQKIQMHQLAEVQEIMSLIDTNLHQWLTEIDLKNYRLYLQAAASEKIPVELGSTIQIERKIANLRAILRQVDFKELTAIDLRVPDIPTVISR